MIVKFLTNWTMLLKGFEIGSKKVQKIFLDNAIKKELLTILFSPACTSFDQYKDFEERGNHFKNIVASSVL